MATVILPRTQLRPSARSLGNKIGSLTFILPMNIENPVDRVLKVSEITSKAKKLPEPLVSYNLTKIFAKLPAFVTNFIFDMMSNQVYCIMSNVRGSPFTLSYEGHEMKGLVGLVPPPNGVTIAAGLASYDDWLVATLNCDAKTIPNPSRILEFYKEELRTLEAKYLTKKPE